MEELYYTTINTPVGYMELKSDQTSLVSVSFIENQHKPSHIQPPVLKEVVIQLNEYFLGKRKQFSLKLKPPGTDFQKKVWNEVLKIPFGKTATYLDLAVQTGSKNNTRAVGLANGKNPIPIIIPCHRIIGTNGKLTGYAGGISRKRWLLQHELKNSEHNELLF